MLLVCTYLKVHQPFPACAIAGFVERGPIVQSKSIANTSLNPNAAAQALQRTGEPSGVFTVGTEKLQP